MLPFEIETAVLCDDIRQERNGKYLLIGVYGGNIIVRSFPTDLQLALWVLARPKTLGRAQVRIRVIGPQQNTLVEGGLEFELKDPARATIMALPGLPLQIQSVGELRFEMASSSDKDEWLPVKTVTVELVPDKARSAG
jgi:hypothetical protein